jgi:hypothetical protein
MGFLGFKMKRITEVIAILKHDWPLLALLLAALFLRVFGLDTMELWWDEFVTLGRSLPNVPDLLSGLMYQSPSPVSTDCSPPLHHLFVHFVLLFTKSNFYIKLPSVFFGCISILAVMLISKRVLNLRCAIISGFFCTVSIFHIYYSRDIRWYSVYYGTSLFAVYFLYLALLSDKVKMWFFHSLFCAASLYASYVAMPAIAGQAVCVFLICAWRWFYEDRKEAVKLFWHATASFCFAFILYSPWLPAQYYAYQSFYGKGGTNTFYFLEFQKIIHFFLEYFYQSSIGKLYLALFVAFFGYVAVLFQKNKVGQLLVLFWGVSQIAFSYIVKTEFSVSPKYVMSCFYLLAFGIGFGIEFLARFADKAFHNRSKIVGWCFSFIVIFILCWSSINLVSFYQGKMYSDKVNLRHIALEKNNVEYIFYENERNYSFLGDWYLADTFKRATGVLTRDYKRYYLLSAAHADFPWAITFYKSKPFVAYKGGVVNRSPLRVVPGESGKWVYTDSYHDMKLFKDAFQVSNATVDFLEGGLVPSDMSKPGSVLYSFKLPKFKDIATGVLSLSALCLKRNVFFPDAKVVISVGNHPAQLKPVGVLDAFSPPGPPVHDGSYRGYYRVTEKWNISDVSSKGDFLYVSLDFTNGTREGAVKIDSFSVQIDGQEDSLYAGKSFKDDWDIVFSNLTDSQKPSWSKSIKPGRLLAFTCDDTLFPEDEATGLQSSQDRLLFLNKFPGVSPVHVVEDSSGKAVVELYDPWLLNPYVTMYGGDDIDLDIDSRIYGYKTKGTINPSMISVGELPLPVSLGAAGQAVGTFPDDGEGRIFVTELFNENATPEDFNALKNIRLITDSSTLTCVGDNSCFVDFRINSLFSFKELMLTTYPRVFSDLGKNNFSRLLVSEDNVNFDLVYELRSNGSGCWIGAGAFPCVDKVPLSGLSKSISIRLEMSNDGGQWLSNGDNPMMFELSLDTRGLPKLPSSTLKLSSPRQQKNKTNILFLDKPVSYFDSLRFGFPVTPFLRYFFR